MNKNKQENKKSNKKDWIVSDEELLKELKKRADTIKKIYERKNSENEHDER